MTDDKKLTPQSPESIKSVEEKVPAQKATAATDNKTSSKHKNTTSKAVKTNSVVAKKPLIAIIALLIALLGVMAVAGLYYWQTQQQMLLEDKLQKQSSTLAAENNVKLQSLLKKQERSLNTLLQAHSKKYSQLNKDKQQALEDKFLSLKAQVNRLSQNQPSDWLLHEAEYLIRIAARTIWLEKDTQAAINLLQDANNRIEELNDPHYLPLQQVIHDDIEALKLLPKLATQDIVLTLISLNKQVNNLPIAMVKIPELTAKLETVSISDNANDWKDNLAISWQKFLDDFITINRREGSVEPLMSPEHQNNLRENLALKLQLAQWAAIEEKAQVYQAALADIEDWLQEYFDQKAPKNQAFLTEISRLKSLLMTYQYPDSLASLRTIRALLKQKNILINSDKSKPKNTPQSVLPEVVPQEKESPPSVIPILPSSQEEPLDNKKESV